MSKWPSCTKQCRRSMLLWYTIKTRSTHYITSLRPSCRSRRSTASCSTTQSIKTWKYCINWFNPICKQWKTGSSCASRRCISAATSWLNSTSIYRTKLAKWRQLNWINWFVNATNWLWIFEVSALLWYLRWMKRRSSSTCLRLERRRKAHICLSSSILDSSNLQNNLRLSKRKTMILFWSKFNWKQVSKMCKR